MPRPLPANYLQSDEKAILTERRQTVSVVDEIIAILIMTGLMVVGAWLLFRFLLPGMPPSGVVVVFSGIGGLALFWMLVRWWHATTSQYIITNARVYKQHGRFRWFLLQTTYDKITDLHVKQGIFGRMFGFGTIQVMTAGTGLQLNGITDPFAVKVQIENARAGFLDTLVNASRAERTAAQKAAVAAGQPVDAPAKRLAGMGESIWRGAPAGVSFLSNFIGGGIMLTVGVVALTTGAIFAGRGEGPLALLPGIFFVVIGSLNIASALIRLRYTRYFVHNGGVVVTSGWLTRRRVETTYSKVTDVQTTQDIWGRMFGYGTIRINTAGSNEAPVNFVGVRDPERLKAAIDQARQA